MPNIQWYNTTEFVENAYKDVESKITTGIIFIILVFFLEQIL